MAEVKHSADEVIDAIKGSRGIKATIMRRLGVHRNTVDNYLKRYATAQQVYDEEVEGVGDIAESLIMDDMVRNRNVDTAKWYARVKLKSRGYNEQVDHEHKGSVDLIVKGYVNVSPDEWPENQDNG